MARQRKFLRLQVLGDILEEKLEEKLEAKRCRANSAHVRQSRLASGLGVQVKVLYTFGVFPLCLEADAREGGRAGSACSSALRL